MVVVEPTVSTHSRLKAADDTGWGYDLDDDVSTHSRLKAADFSVVFIGFPYKVSTHSRLKAADFSKIQRLLFLFCFNTQPPEGG